MPCATGMAKCVRTCRHRQLVTEYRAWRHAAELERERVTAGYEAEMAAYGPLPTFKDWLLARAAPEREDAAA